MNVKDYLEVKEFVELFVATSDGGSDFVPYRELASYVFVGTDIHGADVFHVDFEELVAFVLQNLPEVVMDAYNNSSDESEEETLTWRYLDDEKFRELCDFAAIEYCRVDK